MDKKLKIFLAIGFLLIIAIGYWGIKYNYALIRVTSAESNFNLEFNDQIYQCETSCEIKVAPKAYDLSITKPGFSSMQSKVFLVRGKKEEVVYSPYFLPVFTEFDSSTSLAPFTFDPTSQVLSVFTQDGYALVSTFRNPVSEVEVSVSPDLAYSFISLLNADNQSEYYLVSNQSESRKKINLNTGDSELRPRFKLISDKLLLVEQSQVFLYNLETEQEIVLPVNTLDHVIKISSSKILVLSGQSLDSSYSFNPVAQIESFIDKEDAEIAESLKLPATKIYFYDLETQSYIYLNDLPANIAEPFQFQLLISNNSPVQILTTQQESFQIQLSKN